MTTLTPGQNVVLESATLRIRDHPCKKNPGMIICEVIEDPSGKYFVGYTSYFNIEFLQSTKTSNHG